MCIGGERVRLVIESVVDIFKNRIGCGVGVFLTRVENEV